MLLKVERYNQVGGYHECRDEGGKLRRVDLIVDGSLPEEFAENPKLLIGREIECGHVYAFIEIAEQPRLT